MQRVRCLFFALFAVVLLTLPSVHSDPVSDEDLQDGLEQMDKNKDGKVTLDEVLSALLEEDEEMTDEARQEVDKWGKKVKNIFPSVDKDSDGFLDKVEFKNLAQLLTDMQDEDEKEKRDL